MSKITRKGRRAALGAVKSNERLLETVVQHWASQELQFDCDEQLVGRRLTSWVTFGRVIRCLEVGENVFAVERRRWHVLLRRAEFRAVVYSGCAGFVAVLSADRTRRYFQGEVHAGMSQSFVLRGRLAVLYVRCSFCLWAFRFQRCLVLYSRFLRYVSTLRTNQPTSCCCSVLRKLPQVGFSGLYGFYTAFTRVSFWR